MKQASALSAAAKRAAKFLLPAFEEGSTARTRALRKANALVDEAMTQCIRAGRDDLAFRLQTIGAGLAQQPGPRRKLQPSKSPGERAKAALKKRGASAISI